MTNPDNFRRDREWPCCQPDCKLTFPTAEQMQLHFKLDHTEEEKEAAWAKVPEFIAGRNKVYSLWSVPKGYIYLKRADLSATPLNFE